MTNSSYLYGNDTWGGWGARYFFTFYSEFGGDKRITFAAFEITALFIILVLSLVANIAIAVAIIRYREMRTVTNVFLFNLAIADLVFVLGAPLIAITRITQQWVLGETLCRMLPYSQFVCGSVLLWTLTLISVDRHRCIVVPPYRSRLTPNRAILLTIGTWIFSACVFIPLALWFRIQLVEAPSVSQTGYRFNPGEPVEICTLIFPKSDFLMVSLCFTIPAILFACVLPMILLVYYYQRIFHKLWNSRARWLIPATSTLNTMSTAPPNSNLRRDSELSFSGIVGLNKTLRRLSVTSRMSAPRGSVSLTQHEELRMNKHLRVVRILLLNVILVLIMWLPITIVMILIYIDGSRPTESPLDDYFLRSCHFVWTLIIALLNTLVNPLLYGVLSENFRVCFDKMWRGGGGSSVGGGPEIPGKCTEMPPAISTPLGKLNIPNNSNNSGVSNAQNHSSLTVKNNTTRNGSSASDYSNTSPHPPTRL